MNPKHSFRTVIFLLLLVLVLFGLTGCRLPASRGPDSASPTSENFPVPGETQQQPTAVDVSVFATPTTQAYPAPANPTQAPAQNPPQTATKPAPTSLPQAVDPTPTELVYVQPTPGGPPETITLGAGEYSFCIARRFDVNAAELLELNNLTPDSLLYAGMEIKIPQTGNPFDGERTLQEHPTTYVVDEGETFGSIACYFGDVSPDMIALQNNMLTDQPLEAGEELIIP